MDPRMFYVLPAVVLAFAVVANYAALIVFPKLGLLDFPERYGLKRGRIPYPTGIVAVALFLITFCSVFPIGAQESGMVAAIALLALVSFIDDRKPLPFWLRLAMQVVAALIVFAAGSRIYSITNPLGGVLKLDTLIVDIPGVVSLPVISGIFTIGWLMLTVNALNWFDGIPGQVSSLSAIGFALLGFLALLRNNQPEVAMIAFILAAIALACVFFDFPPPKMLMGDTGSMFFGFMLGLLGIYQGGKVATAFVALGIPLIDAAFVVTRRVLRGASPFKGDRDHLHHRMLDAGMGKRTVVLLMAGISGVLGVSALFLDTTGKALLGAALVAIVGILTILTRRR